MSGEAEVDRDGSRFEVVMDRPWLALLAPLARTPYERGPPIAMSSAGVMLTLSATFTLGLDWAMLMLVSRCGTRW